MSRTPTFNITVPRFILEDEPNCATTDPEIFYAEETYFPGSNKPVSAVYKYERQAKEVCRNCPLIASCLAFALENYEFGIWGGTNERERSVLRGRLTRQRGSRNRSYDHLVK